MEGENIEDAALDAVFSDESDVVEDDSESDGYLSEVLKYKTPLKTFCLLSFEG